MRSNAVVIAAPGAAPALMPVDVDEPRSGEVLVRVVASGVCGSDLHVVQGTSPVANPPLVMGHEGAGVVEAVGDGVSALQAGDHVVLALYGPCLGCRPCLTGDLTRCRGEARVAAVAGRMADGSTRVHGEAGTLHPFVGIGSMAGYAVVRATQAVRIDPDVPLDLACLAGCGVTTGLGAVFNIARVGPGDTVLVIGTGGVGLSVVQGARIAGAARIIAVDPNPARLDLACSLGATDTVDPSTAELEPAVLELESNGVDVAFEVVGDPGLVGTAVGLTRPGGTCVMVGSPPSGSTIELDARTLFEGRRLVGCVGGDNIPERDIPRVIALHRNGQLRLEALVSARFPLERFGDAFAGMEAGELTRAVLLIDA